MPADDISTAELTRSLATVSLETGRQVGVLVHRSGQVDSVVVGDASRLMLLSGGRIVAHGAPVEVLTEPLIAEHYGARVRVLDGLAVVPARDTSPAK